MADENRILSAKEMLVLLAVQRHVRDAYGIKIREDIEATTGQKISFGVLYTILQRFQQQGLLSSRDGEATAERGGRAKRYYSLTGKGQHVLRHTLQSVDRMRGAPHGVSLGGVTT